MMSYNKSKGDCMKQNLSFMEKLADISALKLNKHLKKEGNDLLRLKLGLEIIFINAAKFIVLLLISYYFKLIKETIIMMVTFALLRRNAFGLHALNSIVCTIGSVFMFVGCAYLSHYLLFNNYVVLICFLTINLLLFKYAPGDTEAHPLVGANLRASLKKKSVITGMILMAIALIVPNEMIKTLIVLSSIFEIISILPITYSILGRRYRNYYEFEKSIK